MIKRAITALLGGALVGCGATAPTATAYNGSTAATQSVLVPASKPSTAPSPTAKPKPYNKYQCGNVGSKVFLTFDDVPRSTKGFKKLIDEAARLKIGIAIIPNGEYVKSGLAPVSYARSKGMPVMDHAFNHVNLNTLSRKKVLWQITQPHIASNYVRPPYGNNDATVQKALKDKKKYNCLWNLDPRDWAKGSTPKKAADYIIKNARKGSTVVAHLQHLGKDPSQLARIKNGLAKRGLKLCAPMSVPSPKKLPSVLCS